MMATLKIVVTTDYTSHPVSGKGLIKARATAKGLTPTTRTVGFDHAKDPEQNHEDASFWAMHAQTVKLGLSLGSNAHFDRTRTFAGNGHHRYTYLVEY